MKLKELINSIVGIAKAQPNVNSTFEGDIYELNHYQDVDYCAFVLTQQEHQFSNNDNLATFNFNFFFVDRLTANEDNVIDVQSTAVSFLETLVADIEKLGVIIEKYNIHTFKERFNDICAGAYMTIGIKTYIDDCGEVVKLVNYNDLKVLNATTNGTYNGLYKEVNVDVQQGELIAIQKEYNHNGSYDIEPPKGYDGISSVEVRVQVEPILQTLEVTENGDYFPEGADGFSMVSVDVKPKISEEYYNKLISGKLDEPLIIPEGTKAIPRYAFFYLNYGGDTICPLLEFPEGSVSGGIGQGAFQYARIKKIIVSESNSLNSIYVFAHNPVLEELILNTVAYSGYMCMSCTNLKRVVFGYYGNSVNYIAGSSFEGCTSLEVVDFSASKNVATLQNISAFTNVPTTCTFRIPASLYDAWTTATNWSTLYAQGYNFEKV